MCVGPGKSWWFVSINDDQPFTTHLNESVLRSHESYVRFQIYKFQSSISCQGENSSRSLVCGRVCGRVCSVAPLLINDYGPRYSKWLRTPQTSLWSLLRGCKRSHRWQRCFQEAHILRLAISFVFLTLLTPGEKWVMSACWRRNSALWNMEVTEFRCSIWNMWLRSVTFKQDITVERTAGGLRDAFSISIGLALIAAFVIITVLKLKTSVVSPR